MGHVAGGGGGVLRQCQCGLGATHSEWCILGEYGQVAIAHARCHQFLLGRHGIAIFAIQDSLCHRIFEKICHFSFLLLVEEILGPVEIDENPHTKMG